MVNFVRFNFKIMGMSVGKAIVALLGVWLLVIVLMTGPLLHSTDGDEHITRRLTRAMNELELLKRQNDELRSLLADFKLVSDNNGKSKDELLEELQVRLHKANHLVQNRTLSSSETICDPSKDFELTRRRVINDVLEMWYFMGSELKKLKSAVQDDSAKGKVQHIMDTAADYKRVILNDMRNLSNMDGLAEWRKREAENLSNLIQKRLYRLQNPKDCSKARKLVCNLNKGCGYGCQIHHAVYCMIVAYGTKRTMILKSKGWRYNKEGWEIVFKPVSDTCTTSDGASHSAWPGNDDTQVVELPIIDSISPRPPYLPLAIPKDLSERLIRLHGDPVVWWVSQFLKYLLRPQENLQTAITEATKALGFQKPIVGIHVRRTDKVGTEAAFHSINEYMEHVEEFYRQLELRQPVPVKRVYLASDDPGAIEEAKRRFPSYVFVGDPNVAKTAAVATRYSDSSLRGIIMDIHFLSMSDYLVCTFSSQVCRIAYEIMQMYNPDGSNDFRSLDDIYYFGGQNAHNHIAIYSHKPQHGEIELHPGDVVGIAGNHWNGFSKGLNRRTKYQGLYPSYKTINKVDIVNVPLYRDDEN